MSEIHDATNEDTRSASQLLSEARQALGLSQEEVAQELFLIPAYIRHIDNDQIDQIDKQAFVRGYLRSYAKLVNLDGDDMVARFEKTQGATPQKIEIRGVTQEPVGSTNFTGPVIQTGLLGLIGLGFVIAIVWFLVSSGEEEAPIVVTQVNEPGASLESTPVPDNDPIVNPGVRILEQDAEAAANNLQAATETSRNSLEEAARDLVDEAEQEIDQVAASTAETQTAVDEIESSNQRALLAEAPEAAEDLDPISDAEESSKAINVARTDGVIRVDAGGSDELRFTFTDECWVEIEDADGDAIYGDLNRSGDELVVSGVAPFEVLFGKAPAVTMEFNGEAFDLRPHTTSVDTAKVRVP